MGFYDKFSGGVIGGGKQIEYSLSGIKSIRDSTSGIVGGDIDLYLDAANPLSYPGTGTTWFDLSGNGRNGTLTAGPTFTADLNGTGGYITLDGINDYITFGNVFNYTTQSFTYAIWLRLLSFDPNTGINNMIAWKGNYQVNGWYVEVAPQNGVVNFFTNQTPAATQVSQAIYQPNPSSWPNKGLMPDEFYNICITRNGSSARIYINGIDRTTTVGTHINPTSSSNVFDIGRYNTSGNFPNMRVASVLMYQRALTATEVLQNFNASRKRFGL